MQVKQASLSYGRLVPADVKLIPNPMFKTNQSLVSFSASEVNLWRPSSKLNYIKLSRTDIIMGKPYKRD